MDRYYISTAIPYVNGQPHIGHAMEFIEADAAARYWRARFGDHEVFSVTGTDENSLKNVRAAQAVGEPVEDFVMRHGDEFAGLLNTLDLQYSEFIRTREDRHMHGAQKLWSACKPEDIYTKTYKGLYCVGCEAFYTPKDCPDGICPEHKKPLEEIEEENYFFRLSAYQDQLEQLIETDELQVVPESRKNEVLSFIRSGLEDFSISRSQERAEHWGVPVPGDESQVMYVWFDALSNYINALGYADNGELYQRFWASDQVKRAHVIGKGILRFHAVYWPAMLLSAGVPLPHEIFVHGYINVGGEKMSKSIGNVLHPNDLVEEYGSDAVRYFFLREVPLGADADYNTQRMEERYAELANQLGNLVSRVAAMSQKYFDGQLDTHTIDWQPTTLELQAAMSSYDFKAYCDAVFGIVRQANELIDETKPFKLVKEDESAAKKVLSELAEMIRYIGMALQPITPKAAQEILHRYSQDEILGGDPLFPRRDQV